MGTRSLTYVYDFDRAKGQNPFLCVYRQMDGYILGGHGEELSDFLVGIKLVNGISGGQSAGAFANGMGCLAAQMVANFKKGIGGIYLMSPETVDAGQEYEYHLYSDGIVVFEYETEIFNGSWEEFSAYVGGLKDE